MLRLLADDLTGALDSAAEFSGVFGPVPVAWQSDGEGSLALDSGTREASRDAALVAVRALAPALTGAAIAFKKIDSLLRGHPMAELAACLGVGTWRHVVLAPAFPAMGRITGGGTQFSRAEGGWHRRADLAAMLAAEGLSARVVAPEAPLPAGIAILDAETDADLARIAALGCAAGGPVLWCGSGGLASALAAASPAPRYGALRGPVLGFVGSDQPVSARQLAACGAIELRVPDGSASSAARIKEGLRRHGAAMVGFALPPATSRDDAASRIALALSKLVATLPRPGTLLVAGGETLRALCRALRADGLDAIGLVAPGVPRARLRGGAWDGVELVSKSGAFGGDALWRDLLAANGLLTGTEAA